ncbi:MAG: AlpA family phage regulatory protein [Alphaproteobacteria bacterium]|nr:AlpA family phage regulatory protein [Alphaproteobacteria bacterium]
MKNYLLPDTGFVRLSTVLKIIPVSKSTWWAGVKSGRFPQSIKLGKRITAWRVEDIQRLIAQEKTYVQ